jgi:AcrR family transcriptional regulator
MDQRFGTRRQKAKQETRRIILRNAYTLFGEKGYAKATMRELAAKAGVGLGTIFQHFPDKPSLLAAAYQEDLGKIIQKAFEDLPETGLKEQLLHITRRIYEFYAADPEFSRTLVKEALFLGGEHGAALDSQLTAFLDDVTRLFEKALERGELPKRTHPHQGALAYGSFYFSALVMGLKQPAFDTEEQLQLVETLVDNHFFPQKQ